MMELATRVFKVKQASVITHITDFTTQPGGCVLYCFLILSFYHGQSVIVACPLHTHLFLYSENISSAVSSLGKYGYAIFTLAIITKTRLLALFNETVQL